MPPAVAPPILVVHGGAWDIPADEVAPHTAGCRAAAGAGWEVLARGGSALDAVETAVRSMEDDGTFDAGRGSVLTSDGAVELDAMIMEGRALNLGSVAGLTGVRNAIMVARRILEAGEHILLVGEGARRFAEAQGIPLCDPASLVTERERARWKARKEGGGGYRAAASIGGAHRPLDKIVSPLGTVGAVALDRAGDLAAGTSTGGATFKHPGRVGDSPLVGSGGYADNRAGAASSTGWGEAIAKILMAKTAVDLASRMGSQKAAAESIRILAERVHGFGGIILLSPAGEPGIAHNTPSMGWGMADERGGVRAGVSGR